MKKILYVFSFTLLIGMMFSVSIYDIQYTTDSGDGTYPSPYAGQIVSTSGVVTAVNSFSYYISMPEGGAWKGICVYDQDHVSQVSVGTSIELTGEIYEYYGMTEIKNIDSFSVVGSADVPDPVNVTTDQISNSEEYEGVLVKVQNITVTAEPDNHGQWYIDDSSGACQVDDGFYPDGFEPSITSGQTFSSITGVVDYSYDEYAINPRGESDIQTDTGINDNKSWGRVKSLYK